MQQKEQDPWERDDKPDEDRTGVSEEHQGGEKAAGEIDVQIYGNPDEIEDAEG